MATTQSYDLNVIDAGEQQERRPSVKSFYRCLIGLGVVQLFCGVASLALGIANAVICGLFGSIGYGIWGSLIYFAAGSSGIVAAIRLTRCTVGTHLILSIVAAAAAVVQLGLGAGSAVSDYHIMKADKDPIILPKQVELHGPLDYFFLFGCTTKQRQDYSTYESSGPTVTDALLASFGVIQAIVATLAAVYSCRICVCPSNVGLYTKSRWSSQMTVVTKA